MCGIHRELEEVTVASNPLLFPRQRSKEFRSVSRILTYVKVTPGVGNKPPWVIK